MVVEFQQCQASHTVFPRVGQSPDGLTIYSILLQGKFAKSVFTNLHNLPFQNKTERSESQKKVEMLDWTQFNDELKLKGGTCLTDAQALAWALLGAVAF